MESQNDTHEADRQDRKITQYDSPLSSIRGVLLIEIAITILLVATFVCGMVDIWKLLHDQDLMLLATRHGARAAGAEAHSLETDGDVTNACSDAGSSLALTSAVSLTYRYLCATGVEVDSVHCANPVTGGAANNRTINGTSSSYVDISASFVKLTEDTSNQKVISVSVQSKVGAPNRCYFCLLGMLQGISLNATSVFPAEANCCATGSTTCS